MNRVVVIFVLLSGATAFAYEFTGGRWSLPEGASIQYTVNQRLSTDLADAVCLEGIQVGFDTWTSVGCSHMAWQYGGRTTNTAWGSADGENVVSWRESNWDDSSVALGVTSTIFDGFSGLLQDTDLKFNGVHHRWGYPSVSFNESDVAGVSVHEAGHAIGLDHSRVPGATMWPSTGPGDTSARTLSDDDIDGVCNLYPSDGERPQAVVDAPVAGPMAAPVPGAGFNEACGNTQPCDSAQGLFCISDGMNSYCTQDCDESTPCPSGFYCAQTFEGGGACARGMEPMVDRAGFGESCGNETPCEEGLTCIDDNEDVYCAGPCDGGMCPEGYFCAQFANGGSACARGDAGMTGPLPSMGEPCTPERGLCADGLFCLNDASYTDATTGEPIPYCTGPCDGRSCPDGYRCVGITPGESTACSIVPNAGARGIGDPCWENPERPFEPPTCGDDTNLFCAGQRVAPPGYCTQYCDPTDCCPIDWGCVAVTPVYGQCQAGVSDAVGLECETEKEPVAEPVSSMTAAGALESGTEDEGCGCGVGTRSSLPWLFGLFIFGLCRLRLRRSGL